MRPLRRDSQSKKLAQSLKHQSSSDDPSLIPLDGIYNPPVLMRLFNMSRQALGYHMNHKDRGRALRAFQRPGDKTFYVTAVELYRFLVVHNYLIPASIYHAINRFNHHYGSDAWDQFKELYESNTSGNDSAASGQQPASKPANAIPVAGHVNGRRTKSYPTPPPFVPPVRREILQDALSSGKSITTEQSPDPLDRLLG